jgi:hypothetical protein
MDLGQEAFEALPLEVFLSNTFLPDLGVNQVPVAHARS